MATPKLVQVECRKCKTGLMQFKTIDEANDWLWHHSGTAEHLARVSKKL